MKSLGSTLTSALALTLLCAPAVLGQPKEAAAIEELEKYQEQEEKVAAMFPSPGTATRERLLERLESERERTGLRMRRVKIAFQGANNTIGLGRNVTTISGRGTFQQLIAFLNALERGPQVMIASELVIESLPPVRELDGSSYQPVKFELDASFYTLRPLPPTRPSALLLLFKQRMEKLLALFKTRVLWSRKLVVLAKVMARHPGTWIRKAEIVPKSSAGGGAALDLECSSPGSSLAPAAALRTSVLGEPNLMQHFGSIGSLDVAVKELPAGANYLERVDFDIGLKVKRQLQRDRAPRATGSRLSSQGRRILARLRFAYKEGEWRDVSRAYNELRGRADGLHGDSDLNKDLLPLVVRAHMKLEQLEEAESGLRTLLEYQDDHAEGLYLYALLLSKKKKRKKKKNKEKRPGAKVKELLLASARNGGPVFWGLQSDDGRELRAKVGTPAFLVELMRAVNDFRLPDALHDPFASPIRQYGVTSKNEKDEAK